VVRVGVRMVRVSDANWRGRVGVRVARVVRVRVRAVRVRVARVVEG
jgi:hypothetical protein